MTYVKNQFKRKWRNIEKCDECGTAFKSGDTYYTRFRRGWSTSKVVAHICGSCYNRKFIVA